MKRLWGEFRRRFAIGEIGVRSVPEDHDRGSADWPADERNTVNRMIRYSLVGLVATIGLTACGSSAKPDKMPAPSTTVDAMMPATTKKP